MNGKRPGFRGYAVAVLCYKMICCTLQYSTVMIRQASMTTSVQFLVQGYLFTKGNQINRFTELVYSVSALQLAKLQVHYQALLLIL